MFVSAMGSQGLFNFSVNIWKIKKTYHVRASVLKRPNLPYIQSADPHKLKHS